VTKPRSSTHLSASSRRRRERSTAADSPHRHRPRRRGPLDAPDTIAAHAGILPPKRGTILRIIDFPPEPQDARELERRLHATFGGIYQDAQHDKRRGRHPGMHRTLTVDYAIVLEGEIWAVMEQGETLMRAGDVLIQRGTNHAWANRSAKTARIAFVLIDGA
jgi:hypothetical protein